MGMDSRQPTRIVKTSVRAVRGLLVPVGSALSRDSHSPLLLGFVAVATECPRKTPGARFIGNFSNSVLYRGTLTTVSRTHLLVHRPTCGDTDSQSYGILRTPQGRRLTSVDSCRNSGLAAAPPGPRAVIFSSHTRLLFRVSPCFF